MSHRFNLIDFPKMWKSTEVTVIVMHSFLQPLCYVLVGQLNLHIRCAGVGELISAVSVAQVTPQPSEFGWDLIVSVFLCNHLRKQSFMILQ